MSKKEKHPAQSSKVDIFIPQQQEINQLDSGPNSNDKLSSFCIKSSRKLISLRTEVSPGPCDYDTSYHDMGLKSKKMIEANRCSPKT